MWFDQLERIRKNSTIGRAEESIACESFGVNSNNFGNILLFEELITPRKQQNPKKKVCTRPDGLGVDKNGKVILFEVKVLRPNGLLSAGEQLKAQEKSVRNGRADRHVISMRCPECKNENQFPRPRRSFEKREMLTEFRFSSPLQSKHVYRWIWNKNHDDVLIRNNDIDGEWGVWQLVEEGSFIDGMSED